MTLSVALFGVGFLCNDRYQHENGNGLRSTVLLLLISNSSGLIVMLAVNRFQIGFTPFTLIAAAVASVNSILCTVCSLKSLSKINLSLYSMFAMLGGMMLPFLVGLIFYREQMTLGKGICMVFIILALLLTVQWGDRGSGYIYYIGVFVFNGMSGVLSKLFLEAPYEKANAASYSMWIAITTLFVALIAALILRRKMVFPGRKAIFWSGGHGIVINLANFWLVIALAVLPASVQYPFVTGGTIIVSTLLDFVVGRHPSRRELIAVVLSFVGVLVLVLL